MKPYVICHMASSIDGRILPERWRPELRGSHYEQIHAKLDGQAWFVGRTTGQEFAEATSYPDTTSQRFPREAWFAKRDASAYGVVMDAQGKIAWGRSDIGGDPIVVVLTKQVSDAHLAGLRADNVSYLFAGDTQVDLAQALATLHRELGIERLLLEGGGVVNGSFLRAGLIDEISVIIIPAVDGAAGAPCVFDSPSADAEPPAPVRKIDLIGCEQMEAGVVWLRYRVENEK
jgi:riboflavin biosynthesis pyrimidine reductase